MAEVPYNQGIGQVNPDLTPGNDYQNINVNANQFGGAIAQGIEKFGQGAEKAAEFYKRAVVTDQQNQDQKRIDTLMNGTGHQVGINADGTPKYDQGYLGLKGREALDAREETERQINQIIEDSKNNLQSPDQIREYETGMRRYESFTRDKIGSHSNQQANMWYTQTSQAQAVNSLNRITQDPDNEATFYRNWGDVERAYMHQAELQGGGADLLREAKDRAARDVIKARIEPIFVSDPYRAQKMVEENKDALGAEYEPLFMQVHARATEAYGDANATQKMAKAKQEMPMTDKSHPLFTQVTNSNQGGFSADGLARLVQIESGGKANAVSPGGGYTGLTQMGEEEFKKYGPPGGSRNNPQDSLIAANNYARSNAIILANNIGRPPADADLYLAHQQGAIGASKLLLNPDVAPKDLYITENGKQVSLAAHVAANGGDPNAPARNFTNMWANRFNQTQATTTTQTAGIPNLGQTQVSGAPTISAPSTGQTPQTINQGLDFQRQHAMQATFAERNAGLITEDQANATYRSIEKQYTVQKVAEDSNDKLKKELENKTASDLYNKMKDPLNNPNIVQEIRTAPGLGDNWQLRNQLEHLATHQDPDDTTASPEYLKNLDKVNNGQIDSFSQLSRMQVDGQLKQRDVDELSKAMLRMQNDPAERELQKKKSDALKSIETKIAYFGLEHRPFASEEGKAYFNSNVVNNFETQFKQFRQTEEGKKDAYKFFDEKNIQKFIQGAPGQAQLGVSALKDSTIQKPIVQPPKETPPMPLGMKELGVTDYGWKQAVNSSPVINGQHIADWDKVIENVLMDQSNPAAMQAFNNVLLRMGIKNVKSEDIIKMSKQKPLLPNEQFARGADFALF